jgi:hypothetical protein
MKNAVLSLPSVRGDYDYTDLAGKVQEENWILEKFF